MLVMPFPLGRIPVTVGVLARGVFVVTELAPPTTPLDSDVRTPLGSVGMSGSFCARTKATKRAKRGNVKYLVIVVVGGESAVDDVYNVIFDS